MDSNSFDRLARSMVTPTSRRRALGVLTAGGLFTGRSRGNAVLAAQATTCSYDFVMTVRSGPSASQLLTGDASTPGEVRGQLTFGLDASGALADATLLLPDGTSLPIVGQATGNALQLRINAGPDLVFVNVGVGEQAITACQGAVDGIATGPQAGDLGDWHAVATSQGASQGANQESGRVRITGSAAAPGATGGTGGTGTSGATGNAGSAGGTRGTEGGSGTGSGSGSGSGATTPPDESGACEPGVTNCGDICVDLQSDSQSCGTCGNACPPAQSCVAGACVPPGTECEGGLTHCDGTCVDPTSDPNNCGACGNVCPADTGCIDGECGGNFACQGATTQCPTGCADLSLDPFNCGTCGNACAEGQTCVNGACTDLAPPAPPAQTCPGGQENCFGVCTDTSNDPGNCGACGVPCGPGLFCQSRVCVAGIPACAPGLVACRGVCVNTATDPFNCGSCDFACPAGETCAGSVCAAP